MLGGDQMSQEAMAIKSARRHGDERGTLVCLEAGIHVPFDVRSVVYIHSVPADARRGGHAHYTLHQFIKCVAGAVTVSLTDLHGHNVLVTITEESDGVYIPPMTWAEQYDHKPGTVVLVMSSEHYDESDYIRDWETYAALLLSKAADQGELAGLPRLNKIA